MNNLFKAIKEASGKANKVQAIVTEYVTDKNYDAIVEAAQQIEAAYPVKKDENGKDSNRADRNNLLSILRMALSRAAKALGIPGLTVKLVDGQWQVVEKAEGKASDAGVGDADASGSGADTDADDEASDKLWAAVELVLANLHNGAVLHAIRDGLTNMAKG